MTLTFIYISPISRPCYNYRCTMSIFLHRTLLQSVYISCLLDMQAPSLPCSFCVVFTTELVVLNRTKGASKDLESECPVPLFVPINSHSYLEGDSPIITCSLIFALKQTVTSSCT